jgi:hypothetical protein
VREAAVPLWTEHRCIVRRELRSPLGVRVGRTTLSMVVAVQCKWRARHEHRIRAVSLVPHLFLQVLRSVLQHEQKRVYSITRAQPEIVNYAQR